MNSDLKYDDEKIDSKLTDNLKVVKQIKVSENKKKLLETDLDEINNKSEYSIRASDLSNSIKNQDEITKIK